jgi:hypothetical protein
MITGAEISFGINALKTAVGIAKEAKELKDTSAIRGKVIEMQSLIMEAQTSAIEARAAHAELMVRIRDLEGEIAKAKAWDAEKEKYSLVELQPRNYAYISKAHGNGPEHYLCANCFEQGEKRILQQSDYIRIACPKCKTAVQDKPAPSQLAMTVGRHDPFEDY